MANIFKISDEFLELLHRIEEENEGELTEETAAELEIQEDNLLTKAENYISVIKIKEGLVQTVDQEIKRLQAIKKREQKIIEWLSNNLEFPVLVVVQACATFLVCPGCFELFSADRRPIGRNNDGFFQSVRSCHVPLFVCVPISWLCESLLVVGWAAAGVRPLLNQGPLVLGIPWLLCSWRTVWTPRVGWPTIVFAVQNIEKNHKNR